MKHLSVCLVSFMVIAVNADQTNLTKESFSLSDKEEEDRISGKRWVQPSQPQPFANAIPSSYPEPSKTGQESAKFERTFKDFPAYEAIQNVLINALKPKPIVDTADESEKTAPNYGTKINVLGDLVVRGTETLSRALNSAIDVPKMAISKFSTGITQALNQLGAQLIGL